MDENGDRIPCEYTARIQWKIIRHVKNVHERVYDHVCKECSYATTEKGSLDKHVRRMHRKDESSIIPQRRRHTIEYKLRVVSEAKRIGTREAAGLYKLRERCVSDWRKNELTLIKIINS